MNTKPKSKGGNPLAYLFAKTWRYSEGNLSWLALSWSLFVAVEVIDVLVGPMLWAAIMRTVQESGVTAASFPKLCLLLAGVLGNTLLTWAMHGPGRVIERRNAFLARLNYRRHMLAGILNLPKEWHDGHQSGDTIDKIEKGTSGLFSFAGSAFYLIYPAVKFVASVSVLAYFFPPSLAIVAAMLTLATWIVVRMDRVIVELYRVLNRAENSVAAGLVDAVTNIATVIILRAERLVFDAQMRRAEAPYPEYMRLNRVNELKWFLTSVCSSVTIVAVMGSYFWVHLGAEKGVLIANVYLLYRYLANITEIVERITSAYSEVVVQRARVANAEELGAEFAGENLTDHVLPEGWRALAIENLSFSYGGDGQQLRGVTTTLRRGERRAVVGQTASGKTTFLMIARGVYRGARLRLTVDGAPIEKGFDGISRAIALVPQHSEIFAGTLRHNLTMGAEIADEELLRVAKVSRLTPVIEALPKGLDSTVNEDGVNLSGGERQRLALARALIASRDKSIVLLDEPTSALDAKTSAEVISGVLDECRGKTVVATVHQLELLPLFDRVSVFERGRLVGEGTLEELRDSCPAFVELLRHPERAQSPQ
jgi:ABC-type multidrug transport system fused ATPase/permease subunit